MVSIGRRTNRQPLLGGVRHPRPGTTPPCGSSATASSSRPAATAGAPSRQGGKRWTPRLPTQRCWGLYTVQGCRRQRRRCQHTASSLQGFQPPPRAGLTAVAVTVAQQARQLRHRTTQAQVSVRMEAPVAAPQRSRRRRRQRQRERERQWQAPPHLHGRVHVLEKRQLTVGARACASGRLPCAACGPTRCRHGPSNSTSWPAEWRAGSPGTPAATRRLPAACCAQSYT